MSSSLITTPLDLLLPYQAQWVADESRFKAGIWSRQSGKDFSTAAEAVRDAKMCIRDRDVDRAKGAKEFNGVAVQPGPYVGDDQSQ